MADIKQIKVGDTTYNIEPVTSYYKVGRPDFEMNSDGSLKGYGGFIDFHFFNSSGQPLNSSGSVVSSTPDYTSRIIEDSAGCIHINGTYIAWTGLTSGYIKSNGSIDATTFNENGTSLADKYAAKTHDHDGRYLKWAGSAANTDAMGWGTLTSANGYSILSHASSSDGGDWGMTYQGGKIYMQLDGYYYQNEGQYRVLDTSDSSSFAAAGHTHDDRYYTKSEINLQLNGKSDTDHGHSLATQSASGFMSSTDKKKLDGIAEGATKITVDSSFSSTSWNPVRNNVIYSEFGKIVDFDHDFYQYGDRGSWRLREHHNGANSLDIKYGKITINAQEKTYSVSFYKPFVGTNYAVVFGIYRDDRNSWFVSPLVRNKKSTGFDVYVKGNSALDNSGTLMYIAIRSN